MNERHAKVSSAAFGDHPTWDRTIGPMLALDRQSWMTTAGGLDVPPWDMPHAERLAQVSTMLPRLIVGAYNNDARRHDAESLIGCWIVVEQFLDRMWEEHLSSISEDARLRQLRDQRTYSAAVRAEMLRTVGRLPAELHGKIDAARSARNRLAHRADMASVDPVVGMVAMCAVLEHYLGEPLKIGRELWRANREEAKGEEPWQLSRDM